MIGEKRIPCAAAPSGIKGGCGTIFSVGMSANAGELRRLLYSKREKPVSSTNKKYFHATAVPTLWKTLRAAMRQRARTEEVKREVAIK